MTMPIQEFLNQATYVRTWTPVVTSAMTITLPNNSGQYCIFGQIVVFSIDLNFTTSVAANTYIDFTLPFESYFPGGDIRAFSLYSGRCDLIAAPAAGIAGFSIANSTMRIVRYNFANWGLGACQVFGAGFFQKKYEQ